MVSSSPTTITCLSRSSSSGAFRAGPGSVVRDTSRGCAPVTSVTTSWRRSSGPRASRRSSRRRTRRRRPPGCWCRCRCSRRRRWRRPRSATRSSARPTHRHDRAAAESVGADQRQCPVDVPLPERSQSPNAGSASAAATGSRNANRRRADQVRPPSAPVVSTAVATAPAVAPTAKVVMPRRRCSSSSPICSPRSVRGGGTRSGRRRFLAEWGFPDPRRDPCLTGSSTSSCSAPPASPAA